MDKLNNLVAKAPRRRALSSFVHGLSTANARVRWQNGPHCIRFRERRIPAHISERRYPNTFANRRGVHATLSRQHQSTSHHDQLNKSNGGGSKLDICGSIPIDGKGLQIGQYAEVSRSYSQDDVNAFGKLVGDMNPVHFPANNTPHPFERPIVHGILLSSAFSAIFGTLVPGAIYRSQLLKFHQPVRVDEEVRGRVVVKTLRQINRKGGDGVFCICDTSVTKAATNNASSDEEDGILCVSGEARVWLPGASIADDAT